MTTRWARVARGFVAAAISLFVAAFCHIASGGAVPNALALAACLVLSVFVCVALSAKTLSLPRLSVSVAASQFLFHSVFSLWTTTPVSFAGISGHDHEQFALLATPGAVGASADAGMWLAHAAAAVVTIGALRYGETAFWGLLAVARLWIGSLFATVAALGPVEALPSPVPAEREFLPRALALLLSSMRHRGPPSAERHALA